MKLDEVTKNKLEEIYKSFLNNPKIKVMANIPMHRGSNCYIHSFKVAKLAIKRGLKHDDVDLGKILIGSILHDYYLYDWRTNREMKKGHGKNHPHIAATNAKRDFDISMEVVKIIETHMWPINFKNYPDSKEARIVGRADTEIALIEALTSKRHKRIHAEKYMKYIETLF